MLLERRYFLITRVWDRPIACPPTGANKSGLLQMASKLTPERASETITKNLIYSRAINAFPEETARIAQAAYPHDNLVTRSRDVLCALYHDEQFADSFTMRGRPAEAPLALSGGDGAATVGGLAHPGA